MYCENVVALLRIYGQNLAESAGLSVFELHTRPFADEMRDRYMLPFAIFSMSCEANDEASEDLQKFNCPYRSESRCKCRKCVS